MVGLWGSWVGWLVDLVMRCMVVEALLVSLWTVPRVCWSWCGREREEEEERRYKHSWMEQLRSYDVTHQVTTYFMTLLPLTDASVVSSSSPP